MSPYARAWLVAFVVTLAVELLVAVPLLGGTGASRGRRLGVVLLVNLATHPLVWFWFPAIGLDGVVRLGASEFFALGAETAGYWLVWPALGPSRAFATSALANGASLGAGLVLRALGVPL